MRRDLLEKLTSWSKGLRRKPLILRGARQVGKSWLARELGKEFENFVEINFDKNPEFASVFEKSVDPVILTRNLSNILGETIIPGETLLFLDEIQNCQRAITSLRYFFEEMPELHVIAAGSLLELELAKISVPVGRISFISCETEANLNFCPN